MLIAHAGHWAVTVAYFAPVVLFIGWLLVTQIKQRREQKHGDGSA
jgi:hypothetical protein